MRIQFDITEKEAERFTPFIVSEKYRHAFAHKALNEWIRRQEGNANRKKHGSII